MKIIYIIYQICIGLPIFLAATIITALTTMLGCWLGNGHFWGYYPGKLWSQLTCYLFLLPVKVKGHELLDQKTSYVFVANHQGAFDIFLIYGFLGRNFKWMMKKSLREIPFVGKACESAGFIFVDKTSPRKIYKTIKEAENVLQGGTSLVVFPEGARTYTGQMNAFKKAHSSLQTNCRCQLFRLPSTVPSKFCHAPEKYYPGIRCPSPSIPPSIHWAKREKKTCKC